MKIKELKQLIKDYEQQGKICDETEVILYSCTEGIKSKIAEIAWKDLKKDSILVKKILKLVK